MKKLREIEAIERKVHMMGEGSINEDERRKLQSKSDVESELEELESFHSQRSSSNDLASPKTETPTASGVCVRIMMYYVHTFPFR